MKDNVSGDNAFTQISAEFDDGNIVFKDYPDYWSSHLMTGDLTGNGVADVLLMRFAIGSTYGGGEFSVLHMGENGWEEYPQEFLNNSALKAEQPENFGQLSCVGASIINKNGDTFLRIMAVEDIMEDTVKCIDYSYREEGWFIEDIQLITDYYGMDREAEFLEINPEQNNQILLEDDSQDSVNDSESKFESMAESNAENNEEIKESGEQLPSTQVSEEVQNLRQKMEDFCQVYFSGDIEGVKEFLTDPYSWDIDVYENPEEVKDMETKDITGLAGISELSDFEKYYLSQPFVVPGEDSWTYLSVTFIYENGEWKVSGYGLEK